ncbi:MAG: protein phosphatase 2C domain-containing protein [Chloroflexota bacterium]|nr:protein phosphatase 2C domain-containing protein [Chloroflexota bacterium]
MITSKQAHIHVAAITHPGMSGKNNEDQYAISAYTLGEDAPTPVVLGIVADGIGGHNAGEVASEIAVNIISTAIAESDGSEPLQSLVLGTQQASMMIRQEAEAADDSKGMGSTCVCALVIDDQLYIASMGDSRIYLLRNGKIQRLTTDHSWIQEAIEHRVISKEEAKNHPRRHVIHRYLGSAKPAEVDVRLRLSEGETTEESKANQGMELLPRDHLLLCSDGLTDLVSDEEILAIIQEMPSQEEALQKLVDLANERGGHDNITIVSLLVPKTKKLKPVKLSNAPIWFSILGVLIIIVGNIITYFWWKSSILPPPPVATQAAVQETIAPTETPLPATETPIPTLEAQATYTPWPTNTPED